jgi:hypothetical protein
VKYFGWLTLILGYVLLCLPLSVFAVGCSDLSHGDASDWWLMPVGIAIALPIYFVSKWLMRVGA